MRLSVLVDDPGYSCAAASSGTRIYLDGEIVKHCFTADEDEGKVLVAVIDPETGRLQIDQAAGEIRKEWKTGKVRIEVPDHLKRIIEMERRAGD